MNKSVAVEGVDERKNEERGRQKEVNETVWWEEGSYKKRWPGRNSQF